MIYRRIAYLTYAKLLPYKELDNPYCLTPICYQCKAWVLNKIVMVRGSACKRRKFLCLTCSIKLYGKKEVIKMLKRHVSNLGRKKPRLRSTYLNTIRIISNHN
jgi:hypothetical protein